MAHPDHRSFGKMARVAGLCLLALAGCARPAAVIAPGTGTPDQGLVAQVDALFAENGCRMSSAKLDQTLAGRPDLERTVQQMLVAGALRFHPARPMPFVTSGAGACG